MAPYIGAGTEGGVSLITWDPTDRLRYALDSMVGNGLDAS